MMKYNKTKVHDDDGVMDGECLIIHKTANHTNLDSDSGVVVDN
jgi:hypothetical protein